MSKQKISRASSGATSAARRSMPPVHYEDDDGVSRAASVGRRRGSSGTSYNVRSRTAAASHPTGTTPYSVTASKDDLRTRGPNAAVSASTKQSLSINRKDHLRVNKSILPAGVGAVAIGGNNEPDNLADEVREPDEPARDDAIVAQAVTTDDLADQLREEMRSEIRSELRAQLNQQVVDANLVVVEEGSEGCEEEEYDEEHAQQYDCRGEKEDEPTPFYYKKKSFFIVMFVVVLAATGGVLGAVFGKPDSPTPLPTEPPTLPSTTLPPATWPPVPTPPGVELNLEGTFESNEQDRLEDRYGADVRLSRNGRRMAVSANNKNFVQVFEDTGSGWQQVGETIRQPVEESGGGFGSNLAVNEDGSILAVGAWGPDGPLDGAGQAKVFEYNGNSWNPLGQSLNGDTFGDGFGWDVALSDDGKTLVASAFHGDRPNTLTKEGYVRVFTLEGSLWEQKGDDIVGDDNNGEFGRSLAISADGDRVAIGAKLYGPQDQGQVKVFDFSGHTWDQVGETLLGEEIADYFGSSVALSSDGSTLVAAADGNDRGGNDSGLVRAYRLDDKNSWMPYGQDVLGEKAGGVLGARHIAMSDDGTTIGVGAQHLESNTGKAYVYQINGFTWDQVVGIPGNKEGMFYGSSVSLSGDGKVFAVGAPSDASTGFAHVWSIDA